MANNKEISIEMIAKIVTLAAKTAVDERYLKENKKIYIPDTEVA